MDGVTAALGDNAPTARGQFRQCPLCGVVDGVASLRVAWRDRQRQMVRAGRVRITGNNQYGSAPKELACADWVIDGGLAAISRRTSVTQAGLHASARHRFAVASKPGGGGVSHCPSRRGMPSAIMAWTCDHLRRAVMIKRSHRRRQFAKLGWAGGVDEDQFTNVDRETRGLRADVKPARRMPLQFQRPADARLSQQRVQRLGDMCGIARAGHGFAPAKAGSLLGTDACHARQRGLQLAPDQIAFGSAGFQHHGRSTRAGAVQVHTMTIDADESARRRPALAQVTQAQRVV
jgi:hypothetical protein